MKSIVVQDDVWQELIRLKATLLAKDMSGVIQYLLTSKNLKGESNPVKDQGKASKK